MKMRFVLQRAFACCRCGQYWPRHTGAAGRGISYLSRGGKPAEGAEVAAAAQRLGVDLPRAVTSDSIPVQQMGQVVSMI